MPEYNMTRLADVVSVEEIFTYANDSTNQILMGLIVIALFFIMLFVLKRWEFDKALLSSSFATFILALLLSYAQLVNFMFALFFLIIMAFTGFYMFIIDR